MESKSQLSFLALLRHFKIRFNQHLPKVKKSANIRVACIRVIRVPLQRIKKHQPELSVYSIFLFN
jgi:hypothetical protein